ncbi:MAG: hypothetical protein ABW162_05445 [Candidatus Sedimenticola sp. PURPLELP]
MTWYLQTQTGQFWIRKRHSHSDYRLGFNGELLGIYSSLQEAAYAVSTYDSGYTDWDRAQHGGSHASDLTNWLKINGEPKPSWIANGLAAAS